MQTSLHGVNPHFSIKKCKQQGIGKIEIFLKAHKSSFKWEIMKAKNSKATFSGIRQQSENENFNPYVHRPMNWLGE